MTEHDFSYSTRIGKTTFIVNVKQSESAKKPLDTLFQEICRHEVLGDFSSSGLLNLEKNTKNLLTKRSPKELDTGQRQDLRSFSICRS